METRAMAEIVLDGLELRSLEEVHDRFAQALSLIHISEPTRPY